ncbi:response regulator [Gulosibacter chungangensis]|uniref:Transcriptional regulatory protein n=1 Tax=Gulosibacter chungangensis TaxID=979746 RepID=A0A7J5BA42_9MICO|nr:response regulator [Gulosibacter chungangensis]KAB1642628.1 response regulator [Gulosibacter chungangensis]
MIGVLIVDDEAMSRELHRTYLERLDGFEVVAEAAGARTALAKIFDPNLRDRIQLILLDMTMPDGSGLDVLRQIRAKRLTTDVIPVSGVRDADTVRRVLSHGAVHYLVKPFTFAVFRERLEQYREYREKLDIAKDEPTQSDIDALIGALRPGGSAKPGEELPKGLSPDSLERVRAAIRERGALTAAEAAELVGMSRVTTRRYLEYLQSLGRVERVSRYGTGGRPISEYRWREI